MWKHKLVIEKINIDFFLCWISSKITLSTYRARRNQCNICNAKKFVDEEERTGNFGILWLL